MKKEQQCQPVGQLKGNGMFVPDNIALNGTIAKTANQVRNIEPSEYQTARQS